MKYVFVILSIILLAVNLNASGIYEKWSGSLGVNTGYNTNEFSLDGSGEMGYNNYGVYAGGHYVHNNMMYGYSGVNYSPYNDLTVNYEYNYYPSSDSRNSKYTQYSQQDIGLSYDFKVIEPTINYSWGSDGDWINTNIKHNIDNGWSAYGYYNYSLDNYDDRLGVGIKYEYNK